MRKHLIFTAVAALALGGQALADGVSYNYVQGDLLGAQLKAGGQSTSGSGIALEGSAAFGSMLFGSVDLGTNKYSDNGASVRFTPFSVGLGLHTALNDTVDLLGTASYERVKIKSVDSFSGWGLAAGLRGVASEQFQWNAGIKYRDVGDLKSIFDLTAGGHYYFTPAFSLGLDLTYRKYDKNTLDAKEYIASLNVRYDFGGSF